MVMQPVIKLRESDTEGILTPLGEYYGSFLREDGDFLTNPRKIR
jgi:hypothetical protein